MSTKMQALVLLSVLLAAAVTAPQTEAATKGCRCGVANRRSRIVGGTQTEVREYPWMAGIVTPGSSRTFCGGTILNDRYVLTAAHCITSTNLQVLVRDHDLNHGDGQQRIGVSQIIIHPNYVNYASGYDFALLKLSSLILFYWDNQVAPACPPRAGSLFVGANAIVTGWGTTSEGGSQATKLREVVVPIMSNADCNRYYGIIKSSMVCAGYAAGGKDSCQGDSGGPLVAPQSGRYAIVGVVSFGSGCARPNKPGVYSRVTYVLDWLTQNAGALGCPY